MDKQNSNRVSSAIKHVSSDKSAKTKQLCNLPGTPHFLQRNLGNSIMQSLARSQSSSETGIASNSLSATGRGFSGISSSSCCSGNKVTTAKIQRKLAIGPENDVFEQEADRVAEQVMRMPDSAVNREHPYHDTGVNIRRASVDGNVDGYTGPVPHINQSGGRPLSASTRSFMEPRFGVGFGHVRLHEDREAHHAASQIQARAFTMGNHIWLGKDVDESRQSLMAHELTHVVQQQEAGESSPTVRRTVNVKPDAAAANDILGQFRTICSSVTFGLSGQTITANSSSAASNGCECLSDTVGDPGRTYNINVDTVSNSPISVSLHDGSSVSIPYPSSGPYTIVGTDPEIHMTPSSGSPIDFGAFKRDGSAFWPPNWRILAHELCGHGRLNQSYAGKKGNRPGHDATIDTENTIAGEHGEPVRGKFADPRQGESFHNVAGNKSMIAFMLSDGWHYEAP